ncbi:MAG: response regulator [Desulfobacteraceae bacterium]|nr:response regulator [Desulfobacteraceae bacterium]
MPPEHCAHIFEPYFSTKPPGEGSGLGLAVVHGIVKSCNGDISVTTEQGKGSTFTVYFPRIDTRVSAESLPDYQPTGGTESILLVDDDTFVLDMTTERLKEIGYVVFPFTNSVNALAFFKKAAATLDVVITDHTMPRMSGTELAGEILRHSPDTPVILCTGFSADVDREKAAAMGIVEFIYKPVVLTELAIRLRSVLDGQQKGQAS